MSDEPSSAAGAGEMHGAASAAPGAKREAKPGEPYCSNCGYVLSGATETTVCPECGKPLIEVLVRGRMSWEARARRRYRSEAMLFGLPIIDVNHGLDEQGRRARAKGIIAIGDIATGFIAIGNGWATGVVAIGGGGAAGLAAIGGGCGFGVLSAIGGGLGVGGLALGGMAIGGIANGGGAVGFIAQGGAAAGYYARGGGVAGRYTIGPVNKSKEAVEMFARVEGLVGTPTGIGMIKPVLGALGPMVALSAVGLVLAGYGHWRAGKQRK